MVVSLILVALLAGLFGLSSTLNPIDAILGRAADRRSARPGRQDPTSGAGRGTRRGVRSQGHLGVQPHWQAGVGRRAGPEAGVTGSSGKRARDRR